MALFYNYSSKDFTHTWGGKPYLFKAGEVYEGVIVSSQGGAPLELNEVLARFFSKHLAEFVLNTPEINKNFRPGENGQMIPTDGFPMKYNTTTIDMLVERGITPPDVTLPLPSFADELPIAQKTGTTVISEVPVVEEPIQEPKKRGRPAKNSVDTSPSPSAEFAM